MRKLISSPFYNISARPTSHKSAQAFMYADMIGADIDFGDISDYSEYDEIWFYHGNDFSGGLNIFGGVKKFGGVDKLINLSKFKGKVYSLHYDFPDYAEMIRGRLKGEYPKSWDDIDLDQFGKWTGISATVHPKITKRVTVGDSHTICMYRPGMMINSVPFKTLNGALKEGLKSFLPETELAEAGFYFGNIDIRHHVCRLGDYKEVLTPILNEYVKQVNAIDTETKIVYAPLPIENESRVVPKSGYYKGKPFWGTWQERNDARNFFIETMQKLCNNTDITFDSSWANYLINPKGELSFDHMEKPRSVHLARSSYPFWTGEQNPQKSPSLEDFFA